MIKIVGPAIDRARLVAKFRMCFEVQFDWSLCIVIKILCSVFSNEENFCVIAKYFAKLNSTTAIILKIIKYFCTVCMRHATPGKRNTNFIFQGNHLSGASLK